jgi:hypothetical protein
MDMVAYWHILSVLAACYVGLFAAVFANRRFTTKGEWIKLGGMGLCLVALVVVGIKQM